MKNRDEVEILLVEDNPSDLELTLHSLRSHGLANHIQVAGDGEEALTFLFGDDAPLRAAGKLKLVLLDLKLPKVDGLEVLRAIKGSPETRNIPVVVLTSSREDQDVVDSYQLGVNSYIQKPVDFAQFSEVIGQLGLYWLVVNQVACNNAVAVPQPAEASPGPRRP